jgi:nicotinamide-nucleotide amidase
VGKILQERRLTLAIAESCTGGLLSARMTERAGSSAYFDRGWVTYSNRAKVEDLGIDAALIDRHGAVSEEAARAMAAAARERARADIGVGITGIAGPGGGTPEKPVGLVFIALSGAAGDRVRRVHFPSDRDRVRYQSTQSALEMIRRGLLGLSPL